MATSRDDLSRGCTVAFAAAIAATVGDFAMLHVANAQPLEPGLVSRGSALLLWGYFLGVVAIPVYGVGFWAVARSLRATAPHASRMLLVSGVVGAALGGTIHGVTGIAIAAELRTGSAQQDSIAGLLTFGTFVLPLWVAVATAALVGSAAYAIAVTSSRSPFPRWAAAINPALLTGVLAVGGALSPHFRALLTPAAPNLAHILFFGATMVWLRRAAAQSPGSDPNGK